MPAMCAFCPNDAVEHGGEHVFDDWLNRWLKVSGYVATVSSTTGLSREYDRKQIDLKVPVVCEPCNCGWMSRVTNAMKDTFAYVIRDEASLCILPRGIALLAAFTMIKAVCINHATLENDEPFFTRGQREALRQSLTVPSLGVRMWIGAFQGHALYGHKADISYLSFPKKGIFAGVEFLAFSYVVGCLVLQIFAGRWKQVHHRGRQPLPMLRPNPYWNEAAIQFWPIDGFALVWPPPKHFGDDTIQQFIDRFELPIDLRTPPLG